MARIKRHKKLCWSVAVGAMLVCPWMFVMGDPAAPVGTQGSTVPNPHWRSDQCSVCHNVAPNNFAGIRETDIDAGCLQCHDGIKASPEAHPIGRLLEEPRFKKPPTWPTQDGRLTCSTCHDMVLACKLEDRARAINSNFLRGDPQDTQASFCANCHVLERHERLNAHRMMDASGQPDQAICGYCHASDMPDPQRTHRRGQAELKAPETTLCLGCHTEHIDYFEPGHMGSKVSDAVRAQLKKSQWGQRLPLAQGDTVTCSTCHNPHEAGVFASGSDLASGAMNLDNELAKPKLRGLGKEICSACHAQ